jgi:hypothetical protein
LGSPLFAEQLGPTWYPAEGSFRWMPKRATVVLHGPATPGEKLFLAGYCPAQSVKAGPLKVMAGVDGAPVGQSVLARPNEMFELNFPLPAEAVGKAKIEVAIELDRTFKNPSDGRDLGLIFVTISVR